MTDDYLFKISCEVGVTSSEISVEEITEKLGVSPHRFFRKGEEFSSRHSGTKGVRGYNLWAVSSSERIFKYENVRPAIKELRKILGGKKRERALLELKNDKRCDVSMFIRVETDDAGIGMDVLEDEIAFLNLMNWVHITCLPNREIDG